MKQYHNLLQDVLANGVIKDDRTGTGTYSVFGRQIRFNLQEGFPLLTTKSVHWKSVVHELLWFLAGDTNTDYLNRNGVTIWDEWRDIQGNLGLIYGHQWRSWYNHHTGETIDQISEVIKQIKTNPDSRRLIVSAWNVSDLHKMALPPCHTLFQFYVSNGRLSCQLYQRSADLFLGVPFNIASYALLTHMIAHVSGLQVGEFIHTFGDVHLYQNHVSQALELLRRDEKQLPNIRIDKTKKNIFEIGYKNIHLFGYNPHPPIKAPVAV